VIYADPAPSYDQIVADEQAAAKAANPDADMAQLLGSGHVWESHPLK
jgi:hypothetical protein